MKKEDSGRSVLSGKNPSIGIADEVILIKSVRGTKWMDVEKCK